MTTQELASEGGVAAQEFSGTDFRNALGVFATGVTVITTQGVEHPFGMTANAFSSVSLDPPLVLVCVIKGTVGEESIERNGVFAVNILGDEHEPISRYFSSKDRPRGPDAFREIPHSFGVTGSPILEGAAGFLDCRVHAAHEAGDHIIFIGEVMALGYETDVKPLLFHGGRYRSVTDE
jgi:flavin reductase (DIM6/NTAB) family NADH-FMN oxidoreductase RutF